MKTRIPIKKYVFDPSKTWEESYRLLEAHHEEETRFLVGRIEELEAEDVCYDCKAPTTTRWCGSGNCI